MYRQALNWLRNVFAIEQYQFAHAAVLSYWLLHNGSQLSTVNDHAAMIFAPHQDDETFGCGGMIALKVQQGAAVSVVFLTDGGMTISPGNAGEIAETARAQTRKQEALTALSILGVDVNHVHFLDYPDGQLNHLSDPQSQRVIADLLQLLTDYQPVEAYIPHCKDHHPDHEATYGLVRTAITRSQLQIRLIQYVVWALWKSPFLLKLKPQDLTGAYRISIHAVQDQKHRAIAAYQSQRALLPPQFLKQFYQPFEVFFKR